MDRVAFAAFFTYLKGIIMKNKLLAEMLGTAWLVLGGCGAAVFSAAFPQLGIGFLGVSLAFGLTVVTGAFALGHISGGHFNPAVTIGLTVAGKFCAKSVIPYILAQVVGALLGAFIIYHIATGKAGFDVHAGFAANGFGEHSPGGFSMTSAFIAEAVLTFFFLFIILGVTHNGMLAGIAALPIGLTLALIHLISIPITNTSVNPARSTSQAIFQGGWAMDQLWLFWAAPILGAVVAGLVCRCMHGPCCSKGEACCTDGHPEGKGGCGCH